ncbi:MAG: DUF2339 domain-containing protein [Spirochaetes bacterium]|nr:DUF2339 domain-containing protein [Spirochaetota bacterium]
MKTRMIIIRSMMVLFFIVTLFAAITDFAEGRYITVSWIVFAGVLSAMGAFWRSRECLFASLPFWTAALIRLYFIEATPVGFILLFNARFFMFILAAFLLGAAYVIRRKEPLGPYMIGFAVAAMVTIIIGSLKENYSFVVDRHYRNLGYSYVLSLYAALFFALGLIMKNKMLRISGIALAGLVVLKFYLHDIWTMSKLVKIIAGFTLGIAMVALSIVYQKFRDRIFPKKGSTAAIVAAAALSLLGYDFGPGSAAAAAETFRASSWHYYKAINAAPRGADAPAPVYGKFSLDDEMIRYGSSADYRVTWNGRPRPHMTRMTLDDPKLSGSTVPEVIFRQGDNTSATYVLKLPDPPAGAEYNALEIGAVNQFEASALVEIGKKAGEWESSGNYAVFSYQGTRNNMIRLAMGDRRFLRIRINARQDFTFPKAYYTAARKQSYYIIRVPMKSITRDRDSDIQGSVYYYENSGRKKISRLVMAFTEKRYNRLMEVYSIAPGNKNYYRVMAARLSRSGGDPAEQVIDMNQPVTGSLKLVVIDKDDVPLTLASLTVYVPREELVFELPSRDEWKGGGTLRLYYGNRYSLPPAYDIPSTFDRKLPMAEFTAGPQKKNEAFAYSALEPPVSTWIIRIVFLLGLAGLAYPAWRILRHYTAEGMKS